MNYNATYGNQASVIDMSKKQKMTPEEVGAEAGRLFNSTIGRLYKRLGLPRDFTSVSSEVENRIADAILEIADDRPRGLRKRVFRRLEKN